jgi:hypothetical protein
MSYFSLARLRPLTRFRFPLDPSPSPSHLSPPPPSAALRHPHAPPSAALRHPHAPPYAARAASLHRSLRRRPCIPSHRRHTAALAPPPSSTARPAAPVHHQHCLRADTPPPVRTRTTALTPVPERRPRTVSPPLPLSTLCHPRITASPACHRIVASVLLTVSRWVATKGRVRRSWLRSPLASGLAQPGRPRGPRWWLRPPRSRRLAVLVRS